MFSKNHAAPYSKVITFYKKEPFDLEALYSNPQELPYPDHRIGNTVRSVMFTETRSRGLSSLWGGGNKKNISAVRGNKCVLGEDIRW